jgi:hypothetical protein
MNRRADDRIEMKLPCQLFFPEVWQASVEGITANLHRNGVLIACDLSTTRRELPPLGQRAHVRIVLPANHYFPQKCIECDTTLIRVMQGESGQWHFALRIHNVNFGVWTAEHTHLSDLDGESCRYIV